jgi:hypothetical protein
MMKIKLLPFFLVLLQLGACSSDIDDRIYGTWVAPFGKSEPVIFREDGTVSWFGEEGTFESSQRKDWRDCNWLDVCGHYHGLDLTLPSGNLAGIRQNIEDCPSPSWVHYNPVSQEYVTLYLETELEPSMPSHFEKLGEGWGFSENAGCSGFDVSSSDPIEASAPYSEVDSYVYNPNSDRWEAAQSPLQVANDLLLLHKAQDSYQWTTSLDNGSTWKSLPPIANADMDYISTPHVTDTKIVVAANGGLWIFETASDSPAWVRRKSLENLAIDYVHPTDGIIVLRTFESYPEFKVSHDFGVSWETFDNMSGWGRCLDKYLHTNGVFCAEDGSAFDAQEFRWYDITARTWTQHEVQFDGFSRAGDPTDGVYIRRGNQVIKWMPNGTETTLTTLQGNKHSQRSLFVFDDQIIVNKFGFWRMWR